jgi:2-amino-4-hydroxy-6-hydroxymethyldihydropteridine diphosphokinase
MSPSKPAVTAQTAYLGLGSNQGDRAALLAEALSLLDATAGIRLVALSSLYATAPVGPQDQPEFLNLAAEVSTSLSPEELLAACLGIEAALGRVRGERWGPRTMDLDILLYGDRRIAGPGLEVPHPRMRERAFVLQPLAEIAGSRPLGERTIAEWAAAVGDAGVRKVAGPLAWLGREVSRSQSLDRNGPVLN